MEREPAVIIGACEALALAAIALVAHLAGWSAETTTLVVGLVAPAVALATALWTRSKVVPVASHDTEVAEASLAGERRAVAQWFRDGDTAAG